MFKHDTQRGFTLIELLVVIAIIGILAATVLASLGTARSSGSDAKVKGQLSSARAQAEITYNRDGNYNAVCTDIGSLTSGLTAMDCDVNASPSTQWAVSADLANSGYFCADYTGVAKEYATGTAKGASATVCP